MINYFWVSIKGKNPKKLLGTFIKQKINMEQIKYNKDEILVKVSYEDYKKIKGIRTSYKVDIVKTSGKNRLWQLYQKNKVSLLVFVISVFFIIFMSNLILFINIESDNSKLKKDIKEELISNGITLYTPKKSYKKLKEVGTKIKNNNLNEIEWIELEQKGVTLHVKVIERLNKDNKETNDFKDIVASKNGYIRKVYSRKGQLMKNIDDYVKKGEVIISGNIFRNEKVAGKVRASGKVYAEVWYIVKTNKNLSYTDAEEKTKGKESLKLKINNYKINIISIPRKIDLEKNSVLFKNNTFSLLLDKEKKYSLKKKKYKNIELQKVLETKAKKEINKTLEKDEYIMSQKTLKKYTKNGKMYIEVFFRCYEDIAEERDIKEIVEEKDE